VGDAQVGNWLSWHEIKAEQWRRPEGNRPFNRPGIAEIFARTKVYKVGHHGSHNATLQARGLELMPDGLIAFVPTSKGVPQIANGWEIPIESLMKRLKQKSGGQVVLPYDDSSFTSPAFTRDHLEQSPVTFSAMEARGRQVQPSGDKCELIFRHSCPRFPKAAGSKCNRCVG
jgi:hypothetical protein